MGSIIRRAGLTGLLGTVLALGASTAVHGADDPVIASGPTVAGGLYIGGTVTATYITQGTVRSTTYLWQRCTSATDVSKCTTIAGATARTYKVPAADLGRYLRVTVTLRGNPGTTNATKQSPAAGPVLATAPVVPTPTPTPVPTPEPTPVVKPPEPVPVATPTPTPTPPLTFEVPVTPAPTATPKPGATAPKMLKPFPTVRVRGKLTTRGADVTLLSVSAPKDARITATCTGSGCPVKRVAQAASVKRLTKFQRALKSGLRITITVSKPGYISKVTTLRIRRGAAPLRFDSCLYPGRTKTQRCPAT